MATAKLARQKVAPHKIVTTDAEIDRAIERARQLRMEPLVTQVEYRPGTGLDLFILKLSDGRRYVIPREELQGMQSATNEQLARVEILGGGTGLHWPDLDADFYVPGLLRGIYGTKKWMAEIGRSGGSVKSAAKKRAARANGLKGGRPRKVNSKTNLKRNNHYLPECYQNGFADPSGRVWIKLGSSPEPEHRNPRSVGKKRNLYIRSRNGVENDQVEDFFDKAVESPFASLSRRIKEEQDKFTTLSNEERVAIYRFVASQAVRTLGHRGCVDQQAGRSVDTNTFVSVMVKLMYTIWQAWLMKPPSIHFFTSLPHVGEQFITGDHPVLITRNYENPIWTPTDDPRVVITSAKEILEDPKSEFQLSLSPYVAVSIQIQSSGNVTLPPKTVDPINVRAFNKLIRGQCDLFTLAKNREFLE